MNISAIFADESNEFAPSIVGTVPSTGTAVNKINDDILNHILRRYTSHLFYLGNVYSATTRLPLWFKHFGREETNGAGEAYHIGIFGKTGSGKSTLAQMILLGYARHAEMAIFVIDPVDEFSKYATGQRGTAGLQLNVPQVLSGLNRTLELRNVTQLTLGEWSLFTAILIESGFFDELTINKKDAAANVLVDELQDRRHIRLTELYDRRSFDVLWEILQDEEVLYQSRESRGRIRRKIQTSGIRDTNRKAFGFFRKTP